MINENIDLGDASNMKKKIFYSVVLVSILISSSVVIAAPKETPPGLLKVKNAPGQWKKNESYTFANQSEFVFAVHIRIWERMNETNTLRELAGKVNMINPIGLLKLLNLYVAELEEEPELEE